MTTAVNSKTASAVNSKEPVNSKELGTLVVVVLKARNLPDKHTLTKQDPYATIELGSTKAQTNIDKRGGQHPLWDEELRLKVMPSKTSQNRTLKVACYAKESKGDDLIGSGEVDISETVATGEFDDWVKLETNGAYRGEIYLEMTFFAAGPPPLARRASKLAPSERLWRPPQTSPNASAQPSPYNTPPARYAPELGQQYAQTSPRPTHLAPPRSSHSQSPTLRADAPLPPIPDEVPQSLLPASSRPATGKAASTNTSPKRDPLPIPASLRPGGPARPTNGQQQQRPQTQTHAASSVPTSPTQASYQPGAPAGPAYPSNASHGTARPSDPVYGPPTIPAGHVAPSSQSVYTHPQSVQAPYPPVSPNQAAYGPPQVGHASYPPTSANQPVYGPPRTDYALHQPVSPSPQPTYSTHQPTYPAYTSVPSYPSVPQHQHQHHIPSYDPPPLGFAPSPTHTPVTSPGIIQLSFPEPSITPGPSFPPHTSAYLNNNNTLPPSEPEEERQRRLSTRYSSPMPLPPGAQKPPGSPKPAGMHHQHQHHHQHHQVARTPSPPRPHAKLEPTLAPSQPSTTATATATATTATPAPRPTPSRIPIPPSESYLERERAALARAQQEETDAELARRLAAESEEEGSGSGAASGSGSAGSLTRAGGGVVETDEELARRLARELNSDVLQEGRRRSMDGAGMPGRW